MIRSAQFLLVFALLVLGSRAFAQDTFNKIMAELPQTLPNSHVISSVGCTSNDRLHFNSAGSREFGKRYAEKLLSLPGYKITESK